MSRGRITAVIAFLAILLLVASCGYGSGGSRSETVTADAVNVRIEDFVFNASELTVNKGTRVTWTNDDSAVHTATARDKAFDSGNLSGGQSFSFTFDTPGTYDYYCRIHNQMRGKIVVK